MIINEVVQGSPEWHKLRLGRITASRFSEVMTKPRSKKEQELGLLSKTAENYMQELIAEMMTEEYRELSSVALDWGKQHERDAREEFELQYFTEVQETGFIIHDLMALVGCSPDGITKDAIIEIKCPYNSVNHAKMFLDGNISKRYYAQIQGNLFVTGYKKAFYISYDPRMSERFRLFVKKIERDDDFIQKLVSDITNFTAKYTAELDKLHINYEM